MGSDINKGSLALKGDVLSIFNVEGYTEKGTWYKTLSEHVFTPVEPESAGDSIEGILKGDASNGKLDQVDHILISPTTALILYLEGKIVRRHIADADACNISVTFNDVTFNCPDGPRNFKVVVIPDAKHTAATMDKHGNVV